MRITSAYAQQWPLIVGGIASGLAYGYLVHVSQGYGQAALADLLGVALFCLVCALWILYCLDRRGRVPAIGLIFGFGVLFRVLGVFSFPVLEDDFYRYLWDGFQTATNGTPYGPPPAAFFGQAADNGPMAEVLGAINYPEVPTVYGPTVQWLFLLGHSLTPTSPLFLQTAAAAADCWLLWLLRNVARPWVLLLYAFSPLLVKEFAMTAHVDVFGALFLVLAVCALQRKRWLLVGLLAAAACGVKPFALVAVPFLLGWRWRAWLAFALALLAIAWPFGLRAAWLPGGLQAMSADWFFNAPLYLLAQSLFDVSAAVLAYMKIALLIGFASLWLWQYLRWIQRWWVSGAAPLTALPLSWLTGLFLLLLPVLNPWYLIWWLPFVVSKPWITPWVASAAVLLSYVSGINLTGANIAQYQLPHWVLWLEFGCIGLALLLDWYRFRGATNPTGQNVAG